MLLKNHMLDLLVKFYSDPNCYKTYHGRWDTWLMVKGYTHEYMFMMFKTDEQIKQMISEAKKQVAEIKESPLGKAMTEEE